MPTEPLTSARAFSPQSASAGLQARWGWIVACVTLRVAFGVATLGLVVAVIAPTTIMAVPIRDIEASAFALTRPLIAAGASTLIIGAARAAIGLRLRSP